MSRARRAAFGLTVWMAACCVFAAEPQLTARFIGNEAFAITDGTTTLFTDFPYQSGAFDYMTYPASEVAPAKNGVCLITHAHLDHFDAGLFAKMNAKIIAPPSLAATLPADRVLPFSNKIVYGDLTVEPVKTTHGKIDHYSYLVTWRGRRLFFTGDTEDTKPLLAAKNLDAAFVSPWILQAVGQQKARIDARRVIVYHHTANETVPPVQDRLVPKQGERFVIGAPAPR